MGRLLLLSTPERVRSFHHESFPLWLKQSGIELSATIPNEVTTDLIGDYIHSLYPELYAAHPYIFLWGPRGEVLRDNLSIIRTWLKEDEHGALRRSRIFGMLKYCAELPMSAVYDDTKKHRDHALKLLSDFAGQMYEIELWPPVMNAVKSGNWEQQALMKELDLTKSLYDEVVLHPFFRDMYKVLRSKTTAADEGFLWWARFVLAGTQTWENPELAEIQAQHIAFCETHGLQP